MPSSRLDPFPSVPSVLAPSALALALALAACGGRVELGELAASEQGDGGVASGASGGPASPGGPGAAPEDPVDCSLAGASATEEVLHADTLPSGRDVHVNDFVGAESAVFAGLEAIVGASIGRVVALPEPFAPFDLELGPVSVASLGLLSGDRLAIHLAGYREDTVRIVARATGATVRDVTLGARAYATHPSRPHLFTLEQGGVVRHDVDTGATTPELAQSFTASGFGLTRLAVGPSAVVAESQYQLDDRYLPPELLLAVPGAAPRRLWFAEGLVSNVAVGAEHAYVVVRDDRTKTGGTVSIREIPLTATDLAAGAPRIVAVLPAYATNARVEIDERYVYVAATDASDAEPCPQGAICPLPVVVSRVERVASPSTKATELLRFVGPAVGTSRLRAFGTTSCHLVWSDGRKLVRRPKASFP